MTTTLSLRRPGADGPARMIAWSLAIHAIGVMGLFLVPRGWLVNRQLPPKLMTVSLGSAGVKTGGMNPVGAQRVDEVAPPPKRPETKNAVQPQPETAIAVPKTPPKVIPPKSSVTSPAVMTKRPPVTGEQVTPGPSRAYTGSTTQTTGLAIGGGAGGAETSLPADFCCPEYIAELIRRITANWENKQPETGTTVMKFVINRDGSFSKPELETSSGSVLLDLKARAAFDRLRIDPLPRAYSEDKLTIHLRFPYVR